MAKRRRRKRRKELVAQTLHERVALTRVRKKAQMIEEYGEEWAAERRREYVERLKDEESGARQRAAGHMSPGRRGQYRVSPKVLEAKVQQIHLDHPDWTWNDVCTRVAKKVGYKSVEPVRRATRHLKWRDPRRAKRDTK